MTVRSFPTSERTPNIRSMSLPLRLIYDRPARPRSGREGSSDDLQNRCGNLDLDQGQIDRRDTAFIFRQGDEFFCLMSIAVSARVTGQLSNRLMTSGAGVGLFCCYP